MENKAEIFCKKLADILEVNGVKIEDKLTDFEEWDSLSVLSVIVMAESDYGVTVYAKDIMESKTVKDLLVLLGNRGH